MRKIFGVVLALLLTAGAGILFYKKSGHRAQDTNLGTNASTDSKILAARDTTELTNSNDQLPGSDPVQVKEGEPKAAEAKKAKSDKIPQGTRQGTKGVKTTACTAIYEDVIELGNDSDNLAGKVSEACLKELAAVIKNYDDVLAEFAKCGDPKTTKPDQAKKCQNIAVIFRTAFVENEFKGLDPSDLPSPVLRSMIIFRVLQMNDFMKTEADQDYFNRLLSEEQRLSPEKDMSSLRSMLMGQLVKGNPEKYENDFETLMLDIEKKDPEAALGGRLARYKNNLTDPELQAEVDEFIQRNQQAAYGYYIKAAVQAGKKDWPGADSLMAKAIALAKDKDFYEKERAKFARKEQGFTVNYSFDISL